MLSLVLVLAACGTRSPVAPTAIEPASDAASSLAAIEATVEATLDRSVAPCDDFYRFACGGWIANTEIPGDKTRWVRSFSVIHERNQALLRGIADDAARAPGDDPELARLGHVYGTCMDADAVEAAGAEPLATLLARLDGLQDLEGFARLLGELALIDVAGPLEIETFGDFDDPGLNILHMAQGGLGLPDRDYYVGLDADGEALLADYQAHIARIFTLAGAAEEQAALDARAVVAFEAALAEIHLPRADLRDPEKIYHRLDRDGAAALLPHLPLDAFFEGLGAPDLAAINVMTPGVFEALDGLLVATDIDVLRAYLRWQIAHAFAGRLSSPFVNEDFAFFHERLRGQAAPEPRWKRCVGFAQQHLGDVFAATYVERAFAGDSRERAVDMINRIEHAFDQNLPHLAWMDDATREGARAKVATLQNKIGHPEAWRDYADMTTSPTSWFDNVVAARAATSRYHLGKVGKPVDPDEWFMAASDVNAYYNPLANEMAFPAGILQPPFFDRAYPAAMNYGAIGMVMGHELTHGFDDSGRKFDPEGRMVAWWAPDVSSRFESATACVARQYDGFEALPGLHVNGELTLGENIADLGGIKETHLAYRDWANENGQEPTVAGFNGEQLLFVAFAQSWCTLSTPETTRERVATDSHSPPEFRVNGPLMNLPAFGEAFACEEGQPMRPAETCTVW